MKSASSITVLLFSGVLALAGAAGGSPVKQSSSARKSVVNHDRAVLANLNTALDNLDNSDRASRRAFDREFRTRSVGQWKAIQARTTPVSLAGAHLAVLLAYYRVDYAKNASLLIHLCRLASFDGKGDSAMESNPEYDSLVDEVTSDVLLLYEKYGDQSALRAAVCTRLDGGPGEGQADELDDLWKTNPIPLLRAAAGSRAGIETIDGMIEFDEPTPLQPDNQKLKLHAFYRRMRKSLARYRTSPDARVRAAVAAVARKLPH